MRCCQAIVKRLRRLPPQLRRSLTYDRGTEMAQHLTVSAQLNMPVYFCNPYSPWQRGSNENTNGLIRQYLPKAMDLSTVTAQALQPDRVHAQQSPSAHVRLQLGTRGLRRTAPHERRDGAAALTG